MATWLAPLLEGWANQLATRFNAPVYLVGSALTEEKPRDVDVRVVLRSNVDFVQRYGVPASTCRSIGHDVTPPEVARYRRDVAKLGQWATDTHSRGLNFDVQVTTEPMVIADGHEDKPRIRLDRLGDLPVCTTDEDLDATDGACPCWWRGHDNGAKGMLARTCRHCGMHGHLGDRCPDKGSP